MRWQRSSSDDRDVIDQRGGGGRAPLPGGVRIGGGAGILGVIVTLAIVLLGGGGGGGGGGSVFGGVQDPFGAAVQSPSGGQIPPEKDPDRDLRDFSAYVFSSVQRTWESNFEQQGRAYERAKLVLYSGGVSTACGSATSAAGPFYCPGDRRVYLDLSFYREMAQKLGAPGDFAWAYVIAHEVAHHIQTITGTERQVRDLQRRDPGDANELSVRLELQADCYAGVWAHRVREDLEAGDAEEALGAASAVGDDRLQQAATGSIDRDSFTHGTSKQRVSWFTQGQDSGEPATCDTFSASQL